MEYVVYQKIGKVAHLSLNNPAARNALLAELREELLKTLEEAEADPDVKVLLLTGQGDHFSAGGDVKAMGERTVIQSLDSVQLYNRIVTKMTAMNKPIIAAVHGYVVGAGCSLVLSSDIVLAAKGTKFSLSFLKIGLMPDAGATYHLPRLVGLLRAKELIFGGRFFDEAEARQMGIVSGIYEKEQLLDSALEYAHTLAEGPSLAIGLVKKALHHSLQNDLPGVLEFERMGQSVLQQSKDHREGVKAFKEKRKPNFAGE
ncbi:enoyl-CoA hydratase/isomerase family protein [Effusibacillus consociatus]|uniref:Enoyl-CoA hydratase/isomerase family protein n=1 Tax=Effusibacillus consociatus TaxID=1117041 RepID=A0ABV9PZH1_9BACL